MPEYRTIKELVIDACATEGGMPPCGKLTALVKRHFPNSRWQKTHYSWYKSKINTGDIKVPGLARKRFRDADEVDTGLDTAKESADASVSLEQDLRLYYSTRVGELEEGLMLANGGVEYQTDAGRIDLLARDVLGRLAVIELKAGKAGDAAFGQMLGYMGCLSVDSPSVRGILVASDFDPRVVYAAKALTTVKLLRYRLSFHLQEVAEVRAAAAGGKPD